MTNAGVGRGMFDAASADCEGDLRNTKAKMQREEKRRKDCENRQGQRAKTDKRRNGRKTSRYESHNALLSQDIQPVAKLTLQCGSVCKRQMSRRADTHEGTCNCHIVLTCQPPCKRSSCFLHAENQTSQPSRNLFVRRLHQLAACASRVAS